MRTGEELFNKVWNRIKSLQGQEFKTKTGLTFTFEISGEVFRTNRTNRNITKRDFKKAFDRLPFAGPNKEVKNIFQGPSYIWAVLHDKRVRGNDW